MAYLFLGIFLIIEGLAYLGATVPYKQIIQGICLVAAGIFFILSNL